MLYEVITHPVTSGRGTLKDAMNDALRDWVSNVEDTFYVIGTVAGPHPYPAMVRDFQSVRITSYNVCYTKLLRFIVDKLMIGSTNYFEVFLVFFKIIEPLTLKSNPSNSNIYLMLKN